MIKVVFFANLRETLGTGETEVELPSGSTVSDLISQLRSQFGEAAEVLLAENTRVAVDQSLISDNPVLDGAGEVAFFPPVTGG